MIILSMTHQAVLTVHDTVAQKNFEPVLPPLPDDLDDELEEESVKIVRLVKNKEPLVSFSKKNFLVGVLYAPFTGYIKCIFVRTVLCMKWLFCPPSSRHRSYITFAIDCVS